ncbi:hypothetical protein EV426DRAFT_721975 [Tirmania nivea]|nr:hypothetical protein EV426DRAFT_721975 [Tirmania nivea]
MSSGQTPNKRRRGRPRKEEVIYDTIIVRPYIPIAQLEAPTHTTVSEAGQKALSTTLVKQSAAHGPQMSTAQAGRKATQTVAGAQKVLGIKGPSVRQIKTCGLGLFSAPSALAVASDPSELEKSLPVLLNVLGKVDGPHGDVLPRAEFMGLSEEPNEPVLSGESQTGDDLISFPDHALMPHVVCPEGEHSVIIGQAIWSAPISFSPIAATEPTASEAGIEVDDGLADAPAQEGVEGPTSQYCSLEYHPLSPYIKKEFGEEEELIESEQDHPTGMAVDQISAFLDESLEMFSDHGPSFS